MKRICFIAQFPPPIHGLSKAVETLYNSNLSKDFIFEKVNITNNKTFLITLLKILLSKADLFYFTISQSKGGNLRDLIIMKMISLKNKKCLIHLHGGYYRNMLDKDLSSWQKNINIKFLSKIEGAIVLGPSLRWIFEGLVPDNRIFVASNCVDNDYLMNDSIFEQKLKFLKEKEVHDVLYLSNFIKSKGYLEVLKLANKERKRVENGEKKRLHFNFAGKFYSEEEKNFFQEYIRDNKLESYISYYGIVNGCNKNKLLKLCDIFILLTRYPKEGQPISIIEAMGNGMMILTTNHSGIPDLLTEYQKKYMINKRNIDIDLVYKLLLDVSSDELIKIIKENRRYIVENFSEKLYIKTMRSIFNKV